MFYEKFVKFIALEKRVPYGTTSTSCIIAHAFFQKMAPKSPPIFITFSDTY